jgi:hypothetical protein
MSWSMTKKGTPAAVLEQIKADSGFPYMPEKVVTCIEGLLAETPQDGFAEVYTYGHFSESAGQHFGEAHVIVSKAEPDVAEAPEEAPAGAPPA